MTLLLSSLLSNLVGCIVNTYPSLKKAFRADFSLSPNIVIHSQIQPFCLLCILLHFPSALLLYPAKCFSDKVVLLVRPELRLTECGLDLTEFRMGDERIGT